MFSRSITVPHFNERSHTCSTATRLSDEEYGRALDTIVITCVDLWLEHGQQVLLGKRRHPPRAGWWVIGGRMSAGESPTQTAQRKAEEEAGLQLPPDRFQFLGVYSTCFAQRLQLPQHNGLHSVNLTYRAALSAAEQQQIQLSDREYTQSRWTTFADLMQPEFCQNLMDECIQAICRDRLHIFPTDAATARPTGAGTADP